MSSEYLDLKENYKIAVGKRIKELRENIGENGWTLKKFGASLNPPASTGAVGNWENGRNLPNKSRLEQIAKLGNVTVDYLLTGLSEIDYSKESFDIEQVKAASLKHTLPKAFLSLEALEKFIEQTPTKMKDDFMIDRQLTSAISLCKIQHINYLTQKPSVHFSLFLEYLEAFLTEKESDKRLFMKEQLIELLDELDK